MPESANKGNIAPAGSAELPSWGYMAVIETDASAYGAVNGNMS